MYNCQTPEWHHMHASVSNLKKQRNCDCVLASSSRGINADVKQIGVDQATVRTEKITNHTAKGGVRCQSKVQDDQVINLLENM